MGRLNPFLTADCGQTKKDWIFISIRPATAERITISSARLVRFFLNGSSIIQTVKSPQGFVRDYLPESNFVKIEITDIGG